MKKFLLLPLLILFYNVSSAQVVFLETFDNIDGATAGGPGTYAFPTGWFYVTWITLPRMRLYPM